MKRRTGRFIAAAVLLLCLCQASVLTGWAYTFQAGEVEISMEQDASEVISELGKAENYYEAQSCKHQGKEKVFTYEGFELCTYPASGVDYIKSIWFLGEDTQTAEGIHIGSTIDEMEEAYGDDYTVEKSRYQYTDENCVLTFYTKKGLVNGIEYKALGE
ncbi:MAG: hypothetical protein Q4F29_02515 [Lachnospiraceae bacterium]|nr:hypothetical protein [Lachnospiraceae bacterium]